MIRLGLTAVLLSSSAAVAQEFPQTFDHRFGTTVIGAPPERIVTLSLQNHDNYLALGVVPVGLRGWYAEYPFDAFPWAQAALGDGQPVVLGDALNFEAIAALQPDVIEALWSGITAEDYALLSEIAPVIAAEARYGDFGTPWDVIALTTGRILGQEAAAQAQVDAIRARIAAARAAHPGWAGQTVAVAYVWDGVPGAYTATDIRVQVMHDLGFVTTPALRDAAGGPDATYVEISPEDLTLIDTDVLVWAYDNAAGAGIDALPLRDRMRAHAEGREIRLDDLSGAAFSYASLLSLPYSLDALLPMVEAAADGDPATAVPSP